MRCALDASDVISTAPRNYSVASPVLTDAEMRSCLSAASTADSCSGSPNTYDQQKFLSESLIVNVKEPFWIMSEMTGGKWMSPDDYCQASKKLEVPQGDKRKFWEMLKLLHELPVLNKRCKNRIRTAEQVSQLFRRKEFAALWSAESADCMTTDALMCLVSAQMDKS